MQETYMTDPRVPLSHDYSYNKIKAVNNNDLLYDLISNLSFETSENYIIYYILFDMTD